MHAWTGKLSHRPLFSYHKDLVNILCSSYSFQWRFFDSRNEVLASSCVICVFSVTITISTCVVPVAIERSRMLCPWSKILHVVILYGVTHCYRIFLHQLYSGLICWFRVCVKLLLISPGYLIVVMKSMIQSVT